MPHGTRPIVFVLLLIALTTPLAAQRGRPLHLRGPAYRSGEVIVGYRSGQMTQVLSKAQGTYGASAVKQLPKLRMTVMRSSQASRDLAGFCRALKKLPGVRFAEPNYCLRVLLEAPDDPAYINIDDMYAPMDPDMDPSEYTWYQWGMHQVQALAAWTIYPGTYYTSATKPANAPKVAVIDTGIDYGGADGIPHPDFINADGTSPSAALGGQIDLTDSRNVISGADDATDAADDYGHGTAVAGVIGAAANNGGGSGGDGVVGLGYHCQMMSVKTYDNTGNGTMADTATAILWAVDHGALVINISAGDVFYSQALQDAVDYAWDHGSLVVAAAGNSAEEGNPTMYPASSPGALGVAATALDDSPASYSNYGDYVGIAAPGGDVSLVPLAAFAIWSSVPTDDVPIKPFGIPDSGTYQYQTGTSLACPFVAGLASLYAARFNITQTTPGGVLRIYQALQRGCDNPAGVAGWSPNYGWGRINAEQTLLDANNRGSSVGCLTGQLVYIDTVVANATVRAKVPGTGTVVGSATTHSDGTFRIVNIAPGTYDVTGSYLGKSATNTGVTVVASADTPHVKLVITEGGNRPPTSPTSVAVTPAKPDTSKTLSAAASGGSDPDGQTVSYEYKWEKSTDGGSSWEPGPTGSTLPPENTTRGEKWRAQARSSDGTAFSDWVLSNVVTVVNAPPTLALMEVRPLSPRSDQELQATPSGAADADGDSISYRFSWEKSTNEGSTWTPGPTAKVVTADLIARGEQWRVSGRAYDGTVYSDWVVSAPVTVRNCPPDPATWAKITPVNPTTNSMLTASAGGASDSDGDTVSYRYGWYSSPDGTTGWTAGPSGRTLSPTYTTSGQYWRVGVRAYDGAATSRLFYSSAVLIGNAPPTKPTTVTISPANPTDSSVLRASASGSTDPDGTIPSYRYRWYSTTDGSTWLPGPSGSSLAATATTVGEQWRVAARAYDGQAYSGWTFSAPVTIGAAAVASRTVKASAHAAKAAGGRVQIALSLSAPARVKVEVRNLAGRLVATLPEQSLQAGLSTLLWNGMSSQGTRLPGGNYVLTVEAYGADGALSRTLLPLQR